MSNAEAWITGEYPNQKLNLKLPTGATGPQGPVGPVGPGSTVPGPANTLSVLETVTGPETAGATGPQGVKGDKGDPGGIVLGTLVVNGTDFNTLTADGIYRMDGTTGTNLPPTTYGVLFVHNENTTVGNRIQQTFYPGISAHQGRYIASRGLAGGIWSPWRVIASSRVDQTAGRAIYQWDDLNSREQLIYGDTGWRDIGASILNGHTGFIKIRRTLQHSYLAMDVTPNVANPQADIFNWPAGFQPDSTTYFTTRATSSVSGLNIYTNSTKVAMSTITSWQAGWGSIIWTGVFPCFQAWPTTLPGTASGTIPNL